jgi:glycopeptide antibiotics resistance protein
MTTPTIPILVGGIFAWSIYRRVRRNIGRQKLRPPRIITSIVILSFVSILIIGLSLRHMNLLFSFGGGLLLGVPLGFVGLRLTKFNTTDDGHFYTPNTYIGGALSVLFIGRMFYRFWMMQNAEAVASQPQPFQSPLTLFIFGLVAGYYLVYYIGLFVHTHDKK